MMPLQFENKKEIEELKKVKEIPVKFENGWEAYNSCQVWKDRNIVHVQLCVRNGTGNTIVTLPSECKPSETLFFPLTAVSGDNNNNYGSVNKSGQVQCSNANLGKLMMMNFSYKV